MRKAEAFSRHLISSMVIKKELVILSIAIEIKWLLLNPDYHSYSKELKSGRSRRTIRLGILSNSCHDLPWPMMNKIVLCYPK